MTPKTHTLLTLAAAIGFAGPATADLVATDLNAGGTESGFGAGWVGSTNIRITTPGTDLTYANYNITQTGTPGSVYSANTSHNDRMDSRNLAVAMSGEIWFSALVNVPALDNFAGLAFDSDLTTGGVERYSHALSELRVVLTPTSLIVDMDGGTPPTATGGETGSFAAGTTHLVLGRMTVGAGNDTLDVWVDPNLIGVSGPGGLPTANFTSTTIDFMDSVARIGVPISDDSVIDDTARVDAIRVSDTATAFDDVTGAGGPGDTTDPELAAVDPLSPADDAPAAPVVSDLVVTFNENVAFGTGNITLRTSGGGEVEAFDVANPPAGLTLDGATVTIDPTSDLAPSTGYYVEIDATAIDDTSGNSFAGISGDTTWNFTTTSDDTPPTVGTIDIPTNGATDVPVNSSLVLTFSEDVREGTGNIVIKRTSDNGVVDTIDVTSGNVTIIGGQVTIVPTVNLPELTGLYVEIDPGAFLDLVENPFAGISGSGTWSFTTAAIPPVVVAADLNDGGTDTGFDGGFYNGSNNVFITEAPDLTYAQYSITQTGTIQKVYSSNAGPDRQDLRNLATPMSGEIWFSVLVNIPTGSNYAGLTFNSYGNTYDPITTGARILMGPSQLQVGFNGEAAGTGAGTFAADTTHLLLGQMTVGSGNDTLSVWVDPDVLSGSSLPTPDFTESAVDFADELTILGVAGSKGGGSDVSIDAIRISNTATAFSDVVGIAPDAIITSFEGAGATGVIDGTAKTIALEVPFGTDLATLAPTFTLSSGSCDQTSGSPPSPTFAAQNPVDYVVTDGPTVNTFSVTVTVAPEVGTLVIDLGAGTEIKGGAFIGTGPTNLPLPSLPSGSLLQSIEVNTTLTATDNDNFASDLALLFDPTPGDPGNDFSVGISRWLGTAVHSAATQIEWDAATGEGGPGTQLVDSFTAADWAGSGAIDLGTVGLFLGNNFDQDGGEALQGGTWSGTITLTYLVGSGGGNDFSDWIAGYNVGGQTGIGDDPDGDGVDSGVENFFGTAPDAFTQGLVADTAGGGTFTFTHPQGTLADDLTAAYRWSKGLQTFNADGATDGDNTTVTFSTQADTPSPGITTVTATVTGTATDHLFVDVQVTQP